MKRKIYVVGSSIGYANWMQGELVNKLENTDLVCFTGGEDVSPHLYKEPRHSTTMNSLNRDEYEVGIFHKALKLKKHMIGICRGSQFLCVMNGGKLVQHQQNKYSMHDIYTHDGKKLEITSTHHQAQYPWNLKEGKDFVVLAYTSGLSKMHLDGNNKELYLPIYFAKIPVLNNFSVTLIYHNNNSGSYEVKKYSKIELVK